MNQKYLNNITKKNLVSILRKYNINIKNSNKYTKKQIIDIIIKKNNNKNIETFISLSQGRREYMEDNYFYFENKHIIFSSIFDGHGGKQCSLFLKKNLYNFFKKAIEKYSTIKKSLKISYLIAHDNFCNTRKKSGSTCNTLIISKKTKNYYIANTGDSRAIAYLKNNRVKQITKDHSPTDKNERKMIVKKGGFVKNKRVDGILAMSRAIGDLKIAQHLSCVPDIYSGSTKNILYFVQASDGLFDVLSNRSICLYINSLLKKNIPKKQIPELLIKKALEKGSTDNISVILTFI